MGEFMKNLYISLIGVCLTFGASFLVADDDSEVEEVVVVGSQIKGAKITGAGGGGCMVALSRNPQRVSEQIEISGGKPMISKLVSKGVRLI